MSPRRTKAAPEPTLAEVSEARLDEVRRGVPGAWQRLVEEYGPLVLGVAKELGLAEDDAREVFQETWTSLFEQVEHIRNPGALPAWIATTARRQTWMLLRRRKREGRPVEALELDLPGGEEPVQASLRLERRLHVRRALDALRVRCRELLEALFFARRTPSYEEVGRTLGMASGSVGPTRQRCLAELAERLDAQGFR